MNKQQVDYLLKNYKTQSVKQLADELRLDRKEVQRELRKILAAQAKVPVQAVGTFDAKRYLAWGILSLILLATALIRIHLLPVPLERDEGEYAYIGQLLMRGVPPYVGAYDMKLPGVFVVYALLMTIFGQTHAGIHMGLLVVNAVTIVIVFLLGKRLFNSAAGIASAASFALLSVTHSVQGIFANTEHFLILPVLGGILLLLRALDSGRIKGLFPSGLLLGIGFLMKQHSVIFTAFAGLYLVYYELRSRPVLWKRFLARGVLLALGAVIPFGLTCLYFWSIGAFDKFWFWTFTYARGYATSLPLSDIVIKHFQEQISEILSSCPLLWILAGAGLTALLWNKKARSRVFFTLGFLVFSFFAVCPGFYFRAHYFILLLPAVSLLAGLAVSSAESFLSDPDLAVVRRTIQGLLICIPLLHSIYQERDFLFHMSPEAISRMVYGTNPFVESLEVAKYIQSHTKENDRIAVIGSEPQIYFYSNRLSATKYVLTYWLMEIHKYALKMQQEMTQEIQAARPEFLVFAHINTSWLRRPQSEGFIFDWFERYQEEHYDRVGFVDILLGEETEYLWDQNAVGHAPRSEYWLSIYRRRK